MDEKFLKNIIADDNVQVPDSLLPENIGKLLHQEETKTDTIKAKSSRLKGLSFRVMGAAAAVFVLILTAIAGISMIERGNENQEPVYSYEDIYSKLNTESSSWLKNLTSSVTNVDSTGMVEEGIGEPETASLDYSATNLQELGVDEGDILKTDGSYLYLLKNNYYDAVNQTVEIIKAEGENLSGTGSIQLTGYENYDGVTFSEMYVDGDRLAVVGNAIKYTGMTNNENIISFIIIYDISDKETPIELNRVKQSGRYISSRKSDGIVYLISEFSDLTNIKKDTYSTYIPLCQEEILSIDHIYCPDELTFAGYTVIGSVDFQNPSGYIDSEAVMVNSSDMYVSGDAIYFLSSSFEIEHYKEEGSRTYGKRMSKLIKFDYSKGDISYTAETSVPGETDSQFSFSEYQGYLRLVTTTQEYIRYENQDYDTYNTTYSGLYIFDGQLELTGSIENLAEGEYLKSSRFIGDKAYFVTFRNMDPLFTVDVSDPYHPELLSELKVSGFSEYLHPYGEGKLLGIGYEADITTGSNQGLKLSMFDISDGGDVTEESKYLLDGYYTDALSNHKLILIQPEKNIFGFSSWQSVYNAHDGWYEDYEIYQLFTYNEEEGFVELMACQFDSDYISYDGKARALYIGQYLYIMDENYRFYIYDMNDYSYVGTWTE